MAGNVQNITDADFEEKVLKSSLPVLVDFWAEWCGPCKMIAPVLIELADDNTDTLSIVKMDVDACPETAGKYSIRSIPTLLLFKNGEVVHQIVGAKPKAKLQEEIQEYL